MYKLGVATGSDKCTYIMKRMFVDHYRNLYAYTTIAISVAGSSSFPPLPPPLGRLGFNAWLKLSRRRARFYPPLLIRRGSNP